MDIYKEYKTPDRHNSDIFLACEKFFPHVWEYLRMQTVANSKSISGKIVDLLPDNKVIVSFDNDSELYQFAKSALQNDLRISLSQEFIDWVLSTPDKRINNVYRELCDITLNQEREKQRQENVKKEHARIKKRAKIEEKQKQEEDAKLYRIQQEEEAILEPFRSFVHLAEEILSIEISAHVEHLELSNLDLMLALEWSKLSQVEKKVILSDFRAAILNGKYQKEYELGRVLSARAAEKAALRFFKKHGNQVQDISVQQITGRSGESDWKKGDLSVAGVLYDVKNSRRSPVNPDSYVAHCVPEWKKDRYHADVKIIGVLSAYLWPKFFFNLGSIYIDSTIIILGETEMKKNENLIDHFCSRGRLVVDFSRPKQGRKNFFPPWIFEYPQAIVEKSHVALQKMQNLPVPVFSELKKLRKLQYENPEFRLIPLFIISGINFYESWNEREIYAWEIQFIQQIRQWSQEIGPSLPYLYMTILKHFVEMVFESSEQSENYHPAQYERLIYWANNYEYPLFVYDPLKTIRALVNNLVVLWDQSDLSTKAYSLFQLKGFRIFRGKGKSSDRWETLIAYCGGWDTRKNRSCGTTPLVAGEAMLCSECGYLICPNCGFCSSDFHCQQSQLRQQQIYEKYMSSE